MTKKTSKEVAVKKSTEVSTEMSSMFDGSLGSAGDTLDAVDLRIPKLTLIQALTKAAFNTEKAPVGNFINNVEKTDMGDSIDLFIMNDTKLWELKYMPKGKEKVEYLGTIDYNTTNEDLRKNPRIPAELAEKCEKLGVTVDMLIKGQINMVNRFYVLKVEEVVNGVAFPYMVDFKRSGYQAGVTLKNLFYKMRRVQKLPSYAKVFTLSSEFIQDENDYYIPIVSSGRMIEKEEIDAVENWVREMMTNKDAYQEVNEEGDDYVAEATIVDAEVSGGKPKF